MPFEGGGGGVLKQVEKAMCYLFIATAIWVFAGCGSEDGKGAPTDAGDNAQTSVAFADTSLEAAVRQALKRPAGGLRTQDLAGLNELEARGRGIVSLKGIEQLPNLTRLDLADNRIEDLAPLASLTKLKFLDLDNNRVRDLSALAGLSQLEVVVLGHNQVQDIAPLLGLGQLKSAELSGNPLSGGVENAQLAALQEKGVEVSFQIAPDTPQNPTPESPALGSGPRLAFVGISPEGQSDIYVMDVEKGAIVNLTHQPEQYSELAWSPDGEKLAFFSDDDPKVLGRHLFVIDADGSDRVQLTLFPMEYEWLAWSPGRRILYRGQHLFDYPIFAIEPDGSLSGRLVDIPGTVKGPTWSPDGSQVAFVKSENNSRANLYVVNADGTQPRPLTQRPKTAGRPAWSPDGQQIVFGQVVSVASDGTAEVFLVDVEGGTESNLTQNPAADLDPVWSPDGTKIAFASDRDGNWEIFAMNADGSDPVNLSNDPGQDIMPQWSPDGSALVYIHEVAGDQGKWDYKILTEEGAHGISGVSPSSLAGALFHLHLVHPEGGPATNLTSQGVVCSGPFAWAPK